MSTKSGLEERRKHLVMKLTQKGILTNKRGDLFVDRRAFGLHVGIGLEILSLEDLQLIGELDSGILPGSTAIFLGRRWRHRPGRGWARGPGSRRLHGSHICFPDPNIKISTKSKSRSPLSTSSSSESNSIQSNPPKKNLKKKSDLR